MIKLIKFLKPFTFFILLAVGLLYGQAQADLALPDYMSKIVNVGIQSNGIESAIPEVFQASDFQGILLFVPKEDQAEVLQAFERVTKEQPEYASFEVRFPKLDGGDLYAYTPDKTEDPNQLELILARGMLTAFSKRNGTDLNLEDLDDAMILQMGVQGTSQYLKSLGFDVEATQKAYILKVGGIMLLVSLLGAIASISVGFIASRVAAGLGRNLRRAVFTKVESFSNAEFDQFSTASLITRSTNDITQIQTLMVMMIRMVFYAPLMGIGGVIRALDKSPSMSWIIGIAVLVLLGVILVLFTIALPRFKAIQTLVDKVNLVVRENLTGMMVVRAFNTQSFEEQRFDKANQDLTRTNLFVGRAMAIMFPIMMLIMNGVTLTIVWVGAHQISEATMRVGDMMAFMQYAMQIIMSFLMLSMMFIMIPRASVSAGRVAEVLETDLTVLDPKDPTSFPEDGPGAVVFQNVSFRYHGAENNMIQNISFTAEAGKVTAIIGSTGSGKTTLINLIPRFYDTTEGTVLIDGVPVNQVRQKDLRAIIGYAPQKAALFSGTIRSNLEFANESSSLADLQEALDIAQATEFVNEKPEGLEAPIAQSGSNVSGGQKQRLSIARAVVKKPKIYIFDDTFSALDYKTDVALRKALLKKTNHATVLLVAQRIATIKNADQILVLDEGRLVGVGTHHELMATCKTYQEIALSQLSLEELA